MADIDKVKILVLGDSGTIIIRYPHWPLNAVINFEKCF